MVIDLDHKRVLSELEPDLRLTPASVSKLFITAAALEQWGPDSVFTTRFSSGAQIKDGVLGGDLMLVGAGDPDLDSERLWLLITRLRQAGVRTISCHGTMLRHAVSVGMLLLLTGSSPTCGKLVVPTVLSSDMVLPADNATLWGSATAGATVSLKLTRGTAPAVAQTSIADANGHWAFHLGDISPSTEPANLTLSGDGASLNYTYDTGGERTGITRLLQSLAAEGLALRDIHTKQSSLEEIFVGLIKEGEA